MLKNSQLKNLDIYNNHIQEAIVRVIPWIIDFRGLSPNLHLLIKKKQIDLSSGHYRTLSYSENITV